jgi:hypothetical protein
MKKQLLSLAALVLTASAFGQVENDDMYFNSKDRVALKAQKASEESAYTTMASAKKTRKAEQAAPAEEVINPTDSYSARNVNPEYAARSNSQTAAADNEDYFVNNYQYNKSSDINKWNSNFNGWYNNSWYGNNYYQPSIYGWNSPYYGSAYDPYGNPWCNPYYQSGWSSSFSYYWGNSWNYGWGSGFGMSYGYGNPYAYNPWGYSGFGYSGYGGYGYGGYYPGNIIVVNNNNYYGENGRKVVYGKRAAHGGMVTSPQDAYVAPSRTSYPSSVRQTATGGRVGTTSGRQEDYYNRSWRNSQQTQSYPSRSSSGNSWNNNSWNNNNSNGSWSNHGSSRDSNSSYSPSNSGGGGGATRQSAPSGSGTSGRTRGRD